MRNWLVLVLVLSAGSARADAVLAPYQEDPHAFELAQLRARRPSLFWPIALTAAGGGLVLLGTSQLFNEQSDSPNHRIDITTVAAGAIFTGVGVYWLQRRLRLRNQYSTRIAMLERARPMRPVVIVSAPAPDPRLDGRPSLAGPITLLSCGGGLAVVSGLVLVFGLAVTSVGSAHGSDALIASTLTGFTLGVVLAGAGGIYMHHQLAQQRAFDARSKLTVSSLFPFTVRW